MDFILNHIRFGRLNLHTIGQHTHTSRPDGTPEPDSTLKTVARTKIRHSHQLYLNRPNRIYACHS
jgi:hypothetical protein